MIASHSRYFTKEKKKHTRRNCHAWSYHVSACGSIWCEPSQCVKSVQAFQNQKVPLLQTFRFGKARHHFLIFKNKQKNACSLHLVKHEGEGITEIGQHPAATLHTTLFWQYPRPGALPYTKRSLQMVANHTASNGMKEPCINNNRADIYFHNDKFLCDTLRWHICKSYWSWHYHKPHQVSCTQKCTKNYKTKHFKNLGEYEIPCYFILLPKI
jgi:hypothetical protein